jgi:F-type H+-transporting ATPase subunit gamma
MGKTRDIRKRIGSVRNIHKITRTMERVAQSKGMKLAGRFESAKIYRASLQRLLGEALGAATDSDEAAYEISQHPLGAPRAQIRHVLLFCVTSSRGLCGGYNAKVIQAARARMAALRSEGKEPVLAVMGKKGLAYFRYHSQPVAIAVPDADENMPFHRMDEIATEVLALYTGAGVDAMEVISTRALTKVMQEVRREAILPLTTGNLTPKGTGQKAAAPSVEPNGDPTYLVEPGREKVLATLLPLLVKAVLFCAALEAMLCEQGQRSIAMRSASENAQSMTQRLTRTYNRARQAQITNEMIDIISGSEGGRT